MRAARAEARATDGDRNPFKEGYKESWPQLLGWVGKGFGPPHAAPRRATRSQVPCSIVPSSSPHPLLEREEGRESAGTVNREKSQQKEGLL